MFPVYVLPDPAQARYTWKQLKNGSFNTYLASAVSLSC